MDNKENNSPLSGERVPNGLGVTLEEIQIIEMAFDAYNADRPVSAGHYEPYVVGFEYGYREAQSRIAELEAENAKLREALEGIKTLNGAVPMPAAKRIAEQALKGKEATNEQG